MPNYLERVASSGARRVAIAKPPVSGPPVLPVSRDFSIAPEAVFASEEEQFLETPETNAPARTEDAPKPEVEEITGVTQDTASVASIEPKPRPRPTHERLSSDSPFTVQVPRTLRPISNANVPRPTPVEPQPRVRTSTAAAPEEFTTGEEPTPVINSEKRESAAPSTPARPKPPVANPDQAPVPRPVHTEATLPSTASIPRVDAPPRYTAQPSPPPALPVHLPPAASNATRQEQSRIHIGSLEVLVNNHPQITPVRPAPAPSRTESLNLEKRYLDRFRLRH